MSILCGHISEIESRSVEFCWKYDDDEEEEEERKRVMKRYAMLAAYERGREV